MPLQEKTLVVQRAHLGAKGRQDNDGATSNTQAPEPVSLEALQNPDAKTILNLQVNAAAMLGALIAQNPKTRQSRVIQILNMFSREDIFDDDTFVDIYVDIEVGRLLFYLAF